MTVTPELSPISWWESEPQRYAADRAEVADRFPDLRWVPEGAGGWAGSLPMWPLDRPAPAGLDRLLDGQGLGLLVAYRQAYPMVPPRIYPVHPYPQVLERTQQRWHVNGDGSLCLSQTETAWDPRESICDLLVKAAAWRVEYALMKIGAVKAMTVHGIVSDPSLDELITATANADPDADDATTTAKTR